jgi:hypothetical protein
MPRQLVERLNVALCAIQLAAGDEAMREASANFRITPFPTLWTIHSPRRKSVRGRAIHPRVGGGVQEST